MLAVGSCQSLGMVLPVGVQGTVYLDTHLRDPEEKGYAAAGLLAFRRSTGGVEVLLGRQSLRQGRGRAGTWSFIGGKRDKDETSSVGTAAREAYEESMGHVSVEWLTVLMAQKPAVLWQPVGSYAIYLAEVEQPGDAAVRGISDVLARLPTGEPLPLRRSIPTQEDGNLTVDGAQYDARAATLAVGRSVLDEHGGGPLLLSRFANMLYERLPTSREVLKKSGGAAAWCEEQGIHMASGSPDESRAETIWLAKADALEVDALMWLPWMLLQSRRNYEDPIPLRNRLDVRIHPYFARWVLRSRGVEKIVAGDLVRRHFDRVSGIECSDLSVGSGGLARVITPFMKPPAKVRDNGRAM